MTQVIVVIGAGSIGQAIARRISAGKACAAGGSAPGKRRRGNPAGIHEDMMCKVATAIDIEAPEHFYNRDEEPLLPGRKSLTVLVRADGRTRALRSQWTGGCCLELAHFRLASRRLLSIFRGGPVESGSRCHHQFVRRDESRFTTAR